MGNDINDIVVIGSGNVVWHLINAFSHKGIRVRQVLARNEQSARSLSMTFSIPFVTDPAELVKDAGLYILAVQDDRIREVALNLAIPDALLVHTSGFSSIDTLKGTASGTGVIWPLQTLTAGKTVAYDHIPFFIEGNTVAVSDKLTRLTRLISDQVTITDSPTRQRIHLAAVITSNLTNHLYTIAAKILEKQEISFDVLAPLIRETAEKAVNQHPLFSQTGPAIRKDFEVISRHLQILADNPEFREIYRLISDNIIQLHHDKKQ